MTWGSLSVQLSLVAQSCPTLRDPMDCSTPGLPVHHQLPESTQTHVHWVSDAIQPSHPLSPPSPPAFNLSQHQGLFKWDSSSHQVAKVLEFQLQHSSSSEYSGMISFSLDWLDRTLVVTCEAHPDQLYKTVHHSFLCAYLTQGPLFPPHTFPLLFSDLSPPP